MEAQRLVRRAPVGESIVEAILDLVRAARPGEGDAEITKHISWGPGPARRPGSDAGDAARAPCSTGGCRPPRTISRLWPSRC